MTTPCRFDGCASAGEAAFSDENGSTRMPFGGAGLSATPARPRPRSSSSSTIRPPNEWPISTGGWSSSRDQRLVVVDDLAQAEAGELVGVLAQLLDVAVLARPLGRARRRSRACRSSRRSSPSCAPTATRRGSAPAGSAVVAVATVASSRSMAATLRRARRTGKSDRRTDPDPAATQSSGSSVRAARSSASPRRRARRSAASTSSRRRRRRQPLARSIGKLSGGSNGTATTPAIGSRDPVADERGDRLARSRPAASAGPTARSASRASARARSRRRGDGAEPGVEGRPVGSRGSSTRSAANAPTGIASAPA